MQPTQPTAKNDSHRIREKYIWLGTDADGGTHLYRTTDETIFAFDAAGRIEYRFDIGSDPRTADHYVAHVKSERGWSDCQFGFEAFVDRFAEAV